MEPDRIRRVEAIPTRPCPTAGEVALREPRLVAFSGPWAPASRPEVPAADDDGLGAVEPAPPHPRATPLTTKASPEHAMHSVR